MLKCLRKINDLLNGLGNTIGLKVEDYNSMKETINGETPDFNIILLSLIELEKILNTTFSPAF